MDRSAPSQWPYGVIVGVGVAVLDVFSKSFLGEIALDSADGSVGFAPLLELVAVDEGGAGGQALLAGLVGATLAVLVLLSRAPARSIAVGLGFVLGGLLGKFLDRWDDGAAIDILRLGAGPPVSLADMSFGVGVVVLASAGLRRRRRRG
ncbi:MAG: signal peptidase II [Pseudomonadota bacterium]